MGSILLWFNILPTVGDGAVDECKPIRDEIDLRSLQTSTTRPEQLFHVTVTGNEQVDLNRGKYTRLNADRVQLDPTIFISMKLCTTVVIPILVSPSPLVVP